MMEIRPRTAGEILDDAGRLALADTPLLLALSSLFAVPTAAAFLLLLTLPAPEGLTQFLLPAVTALLLPLTGLGSGACQTVFRRRAEGRPATIFGCLAETLRRGLDHVAARGMVWTLTLLGTLIVIVPAAFLLSGFLALATLFDSLTGLIVRLLLVTFALAAVQGLAVCAGGVAVHPLLAGGDCRCFGAWAAAVREAQRQAGKAAVVTLARPFLWMVAVVNLHVLIRVGLWAGDSLAGLDLALPSLVLSTTNPAYEAALALLAWLLLVPYFEACDYLLHADARARYEGLDLWYRVRRLFPAGGKVRTAVIAILLMAGPAFGADRRLEAVQAARKEVGQMTRQIETVRRYQGKDWLPQLRAVAERLDEDGPHRPGRYRWFAQALTGFEQKKRPAALQVLADLDRRLALIEQALTHPPEEPAEVVAASSPHSKDDIRAALPADSTVPATPPRNRMRRDEPETRRPVRRDGPAEDGRADRERQGPGAVNPAPPSGTANPRLWMAAAGVLAMIVVLAVLLRRRRSTTAKAPVVPSNPDALSLAALMSQAERQGGDGLWRQADDLAQTGKLLEAVRTLYLAVLAILHRADLIRYAPTRTNGEYVRQLRSREEVCGPFRGLTGLFEIKWYGERSCDPADYDRCRRLAEEVRQRATK